MPPKSVSQCNAMVATVNCKGGTQVSEAEGGCQERWEEGATSSSQERWGGVQLVVLCKISSQRKTPLSLFSILYLTVKLARLVKGDGRGRPV